MKYIKFTSDSDCFTAKRVGHFVHLTWFSTLDLSSVKNVGLANIQLHPMLENPEYDYYMILYCNLIQTSELNARGEYECIRIPKKHRTIPSQLHLGKFIKIHLNSDDSAQINKIVTHV